MLVTPVFSTSVDSFPRMRARVDATHSIITSRQRVEATMTAEISTMRQGGFPAMWNSCRIQRLDSFD